jgi:hypothetical protein
MPGQQSRSGRMLAECGYDVRVGWTMPGSVNIGRRSGADHPMVNYRKHAVAIAFAAAVSLVSAACGGGTSSSTTATSACQTAYRTWADGPHGKAAFNQISTDVGIVSADLQQVASNERAGLVTAAFNAGTKLGQESYHALQYLPPSCVPGLARPYRAALSDARQGAIAIMAAMTALRIGNQSAATSYVNAFASDLGQAQLNIKAAQVAVAREVKSGA